MKKHNLGRTSEGLQGPFQKIAEEMGYALRHINRMHGDSLREFARANEEIFKKC